MSFSVNLKKLEQLSLRASLSGITQIYAGGNDLPSLMALGTFALPTAVKGGCIHKLFKLWFPFYQHEAFVCLSRLGKSHSFA